MDRGSFSVEIMLTLLAWKALEPGCIHLTRGNHETKSMNKIYGFEGAGGRGGGGVLEGGFLRRRF